MQVRLIGSMQVRSSACVVGALALGALACSGGATTGVSAPTGIAASIQVVGGQDQSGTESAELPNPLLVRVVDLLGTPVTGQLVNFRVVAGGGSMFAGASITNAQGLAQDRWTVGLATADSQVAEARAVDNDTGQPLVFARFKATAIALATPALAISAGEFHTCALKQNGAASCWGYNADGGIGDGTTTDRSIPTAVSGGRKFASIAIGGRHSCGVLQDSTAYCWGDNQFGAVGDGATANRVVPVAVSGGLRFQNVSAGDYFQTCGLSSSNSAAYCWGEIVDSTYGLTPTSLGGNYTTITSSGAHGCALNATGIAYCWGDNQEGELGNGEFGRGAESPFVFTPPAPVAGSIQFVRLSAGNGHTCGLDMTGKPYCWGYNVKGEVGDGSTANQDAPTAVASTVVFTEIAAGWYFTCALTSDGAAYCWGDNQFGQLGDSTTTEQHTPVRVKGNHHFRQITAGAGHSCAIDTNQAAYCWGSNRFGQLGDGTLLDRLVPTAVRPLAGP